MPVAESIQGFQEARIRVSGWEHTADRRERLVRETPRNMA